MSSVDHVLLTRFNLPSGGVEATIRASEHWLSNRWMLFERYCAPSVSSQSEKNFSWIIYFDPESPRWLVDKVTEISRNGLFTPIYRASVSREQLLGDIRGVAQGTGQRLVTSNLDNDDALARDFVARIQAVPLPEERTAVFITHGLIASPAGLYLRIDRDNAFCTVIESWDDPTTCWSDWHMMLRRSMPAIELEGAPGWLQVVHGENVSNRVRGRLVSPDQWRSRFADDLAGVRVPGRAQIARDRVLLAPARAVSESARGSVKWLALSVLGKDGMDRLKSAIAARTRPHPPR
ncbi:glycosyltransferase [Microterricola viridarii]|uniref:Putative rhamnosyl transferase n=1 Tax=Microterricola viridarii TaxID=412690 RepID=A0A1H1P8D6_9MICO|nr:glycosyltransferase [Microterricola viridarii]SDS07511.1 Putative rhamnosyl transferase [Microterricola viridarii]